jgi:hypothetical protein
MEALPGLLNGVAVVAVLAAASKCIQADQQQEKGHHSRCLQLKSRVFMGDL